MTQTILIIKIYCNIRSYRIKRVWTQSRHNAIPLSILLSHSHWWNRASRILLCLPRIVDLINDMEIQTSMMLKLQRFVCFFFRKNFKRCASKLLTVSKSKFPQEWSFIFPIVSAIAALCLSTHECTIAHARNIDRYEIKIVSSSNCVVKFKMFFFSSIFYFCCAFGKKNLLQCFPNRYGFDWDNRN